MANMRKSCRVLIVEDNELMRKTIRAFLSDLGAEIVGEAIDGNEAVQAYDKHRPDITLLDIELPGKSGTEVLQEIIGREPTAYIVMLTAVSDMSVADACIEAGAQSYIRKGAAPDAFKAMLKARIVDIMTN